MAGLLDALVAILGARVVDEGLLLGPSSKLTRSLVAIVVPASAVASAALAVLAMETGPGSR